MKANFIHQFPEHHIPFDVFFAVTNLDKLVKLLLDESNLYSQQNGRELHSIEQEMRAFLGINYIMSINKPPTIKSFGNTDSSFVMRALEMLWLDQDLNTFYKIAIFWVTQKMTAVAKVTKSDPLSTILTIVLVILFQMMILEAFTSVSWNSMVDQAWNKQYLKNKPIEWNFK